MSNTTLLLLTIAAMMLAAVPVAMMLKRFLPDFLHRSAGIDQLENRIYVLHSEIHELQDRVNGKVQRRNQVSAEKHRAETENRKMERAIAEIALQPPVFVHEVGDPQAGLSKFLVNVAQEKASAGGDKAQVNPIWRCANVAEVWASGAEEAKQLVEVAFPFKMGFTKNFQRTQGRPNPGRIKAPAS
ncbi:hypothetical protein JJL56_17500 [Azospirillum sp. YIM DDC1]|mgnify:CR=1 FL=1|jgi:hypothetical protein|uniref:Uncharacterized protein n=1 Tax=Azospirillum aestuarii TaxID=2802052 RepID=A0ABS1I0T7_9PROT|nr:hypothetical protein [Azospirillum aestuarii]MBK3772840.1 hypothetical protein [Azospirillum brasilense]MBK4720667.1 hypothetical protein [Azospirillum aestuarii]TWA88090.1 hypothetical protein FBY14_109139 [Azospirillum brasilense]